MFLLQPPKLSVSFPCSQRNHCHSQLACAHTGQPSSTTARSARFKHLTVPTSPLRHPTDQSRRHTMNCDNPTPRVGFAQLKNYINRRVLFVGRIESTDNGCFHVQAPDGSKVVVQSNSNFETQFVEVAGVVVDPMTIREESHVNLGENFDLNLYNEFLKLATGPHVELFQPRGF